MTTDTKRLREIAQSMPSTDVVARALLLAFDVVEAGERLVDAHSGESATGATCVDFQDAIDAFRAEFPKEET